MQDKPIISLHTQPRRLRVLEQTFTTDRNAGCCEVCVIALLLIIFPAFPEVSLWVIPEDSFVIIITSALSV